VVAAAANFSRCYGNMCSLPRSNFAASARYKNCDGPLSIKQLTRFKILNLTYQLMEFYIQ